MQRRPFSSDFLPDLEEELNYDEPYECSCAETNEASGIEYNDVEYDVQYARPAIVQDEPLYANESQPIEFSDPTLSLLTYKDIICSEKAEQMIKQEKEDERLAKKLFESDVSYDEEKDFQYAKHLHEKERAKLQRAKERSKRKKLINQNKNTAEDKADDPPLSSERSPEPSSHERTPSHPKSEILEVIPPYMPMQSQTGKKSVALEIKLKRKKEKEGCTQQ